MKTLLVMTVGQTDVQLVVRNQRHKLDGSTCGTLHDAINERSWSVVDTPTTRNRELIMTLPDTKLNLCTPKLDAVLAYLDSTLPTSTLIFETVRQGARDPRLSGEVMERRLRDRGVNQVKRVAFLTGTEQLEDPSNEVDAVVRRTIVSRLSDAIRTQVEQLTENDQVFVATTGGLAAANELINEMVRLHALSGPTVTALEVPDRERVQGEDLAIEERFHPATGFRARWYALSLIEKGNLLGAWGAVSHLKDEPGQGWTQVIEWLAQFACSLPFEPPLPSDSELMVLNHQRMSVRAALRVELALRAGDIPRAVHGTVAFFEAALWDHLLDNFEYSDQRQGNAAVVTLRLGAKVPNGKKLLRNDEPDDNKKRNCPFEHSENRTYLFFEDGAGRFARDYVNSKSLKDLVVTVDKVKVLRNDVAHNEPTPSLMKVARSRMEAAQLWSNDKSNNIKFLSQPLVQDVLKELGEPDPAQLCENLLSTVRKRLRTID
ncbi:hypothetical protein [Planctomicrobium sp. SH664]|uniref:hypothetical protein n=1 Tax=Planctomicrobium sp. SH664 TaxID=3448125 RepID=UPI003F5C47C0